MIYACNRAGCGLGGEAGMTSEIIPCYNIRRHDICLQYIKCEYNNLSDTTVTVKEATSGKEGATLGV